MRHSAARGFHYLTVMGLAIAVASLPFSIKLCHGALALVVLGWILQGDWREKWKACITNPIVIAFGAFFFLHLVGMVYTDDTAAGWFDIEKKVALILLPVVLVSTPALNARHLIIIFSIFIVACIAGTVMCIGRAVQTVTTGAIADPLSASVFWLINPHASKNWMAFSYTGLASGIGMHPTYFSMYLIFCLLLIYKIFSRDFFIHSRGFQLTLIAVCLYLGIFIIFLSSRITTLALVFFVFMGCYSLDSEEARLKRLTYSLTISFFFLIMIYVNPVSRYRNYQEIMYASYPASHIKPRSLSADIRTSLWWVGIRSIHETNFIVGAGTGDVDKLMKTTGKKYSMYNILGSNDPHSQYIFTMLGLGFIGLLSLLACFTIPVAGAWRQRNFLYLSFAGLFILICFTETILEIQKGIVFFSIFNSLLIFQCPNGSCFQGLDFGKPPLSKMFKA